MKVTQELVYGIAMGYVFRQWMKREKTENAQVEIKAYDMVEQH